mmetsp:Transcript_54011/g.96730  ORF Transcript_54011/g.96730 Transcript_54011/m.96730 type:complete len:103 (+) Transcript_54011:155-463(+)|eukprot:CAMPEP_0197680732 /NCGR_PEP_ID=MMETSP1338-20131121/93775_1 /TAXON_ID=43686 ORGANISM="Pelagodinium beii, Strain RCC1491" /NCGR_SAMPLE_ID=MMETSP1338 /ASSEMBLY_ACC=CAM_ASM_000754 /LENGTH=102 /DNA_ID=CAMNT_0043261959 /DNA_START=98 /DNA_END=406 /DNA_ORIENTATION=-
MALARAAMAVRPALRAAAKVARPAVVATRPMSSASVPQDIIDKQVKSHQEWVASTKDLPVYVPEFYWTLEFILPNLMDLHQYQESPVIVEVQDRNPVPDVFH